MIPTLACEWRFEMENWRGDADSAMPLQLAHSRGTRGNAERVDARGWRRSASRNAIRRSVIHLTVRCGPEIPSCRLSQSEMSSWVTGRKPFASCANRG